MAEGVISRAGLAVHVGVAFVALYYRMCLDGLYENVCEFILCEAPGWPVQVSIVSKIIFCNADVWPDQR